MSAGGKGRGSTAFGSATTEDGRVLAWQDGGDPHGYPVIGLHGTPGCRLARVADDRVYADAGVRYVTTDRAGYGRSSRNHGRLVADEAADVAVVADALGLDTFAVSGGSGGGPHALAVAALLPDRVTRVASLAGLAPLATTTGRHGLSRADWSECMDMSNLEELAWSLQGEAALQAGLRGRLEEMERSLVEDPSVLLGTEMSDSDRAFLADPGVAATFRAVIREAGRQGVMGWVDDSLAFVAPWGFEPADIRCPALVLYGLEDSTLNPRHGEWLASRLPDVTVVVEDKGGHMPLDFEREIAEVMTWLRTGERSPRWETSE